MAQTTSYWQNKMLDAISADPILSEMNSPSQVAVYRLLTFIVATAINLFEQTLDIFKIEIEDIASKSVPGTAPWIRDQVFRFQYDAANPQIVVLVDFAPGYSTVDEDLQIITRCSVKTDANKIVNIKVAKSEPPEELASLEQTALVSYLGEINPVGVQYNVINLASDKLQVYADVYYNGQYSASIQGNVNAAINSYLSNLDFDGIIKVSEIEDAIQSVEGVTDILITEVKARRDTTIAASATQVVRIYETNAGYIVEEDTASFTFNDTINYIAET